MIVDCDDYTHCSFQNMHLQMFLFDIHVHACMHDGAWVEGRKGAHVQGLELVDDSAGGGDLVKDNVVCTWRAFLADPNAESATDKPPA
jgi:hypothetical protein